MVVLVIPLILELLMNTDVANKCSGSDDGWLGFWGGYLGAVIAIGGVYWSVNKQLRGDKEGTYRMSRPFFIVNLKKHLVKTSEIYASNDVTNITNANSFMCINNVSSKNMYAVKVIVEGYNLLDRKQKSKTPTDCFKQTFKYFLDPQKGNFKFYNKDGEEIFPTEPENLETSYANAISIDKIAAGQRVILCFPNKNISAVWIWYTTEIRESIKLYFSISDKNTRELIYRKDDHLLENQLEWKNEGKYDSNYSLMDFQQSKRL